MIEICALASGSNGNCYYVGNEHEAVLIDAGISCKQVMERMLARNLNVRKIKAIFISHEHVDHIRGARVLSKKLNVPVYFTYGTWNNAHKSSKPLLHKFFKPNQSIQTGSITIHSFSKQHDASEPCSFRVEVDNLNIGVMTDIGEACDQVINHLKACDALFLESNYDENMLWNGNYPWPLKKRVASAHGHLSNDQALNLLLEHAASKLQTVFLSHLSAENNTPELAFDNFQPLHERFEVLLTSRFDASVVKVFENNAS